MYIKVQNIHSYLFLVPCIYFSRNTTRYYLQNLHPKVYILKLQHNILISFLLLYYFCILEKELYWTKIVKLVNFWPMMQLNETNMFSHLSHKQALILQYMHQHFAKGIFTEIKPNTANCLWWKSYKAVMDIKVTMNYNNVAKIFITRVEHL